jgi:hypothetical protein
MDVMIFDGVAKKHDFRGIQRKIPQISNFDKNWDLNPPSHDTAADITKCLQKIYHENRISGQKTRFSRKSDRIFAKFPGLYPENWIRQKTFFTIFAFFPLLYDFCKKYLYDPTRKNRISQKSFFTIFAIFLQVYDFCKINIYMSLSAKIGFCKKLFSQFLRFSATVRFSKNKYFYDPIRKNRISRKTFFTIFAIYGVFPKISVFRKNWCFAKNCVFLQK